MERILGHYADRLRDITRLSTRQLFFIGGAPRSGTTWLQQILDAHPEISCKGEGLFLNHLADPLEKMMRERGAVIEQKNKTLFRHTGGYPRPHQDDTEFLVGTAILLALDRQNENKAGARAIGEKTPENVFFYPRLRRLFPTAKFISIARDPRDVLTSAWHFFRKDAAERSDHTAMMEFVRRSLLSLNEGARRMIEYGKEYPEDHLLVTYEELCADPEPIVARLFRKLGVAHDAFLVQDCLARTAFEVQTNGREIGHARNGAFHRKGVAGDWRSTLPPEVNEVILRDLEWMFPYFGWKIEGE